MHHLSFPARCQPYSRQPLGPLRHRHIIARIHHDELTGDQFHYPVYMRHQPQVRLIAVQHHRVRPVIRSRHLLHDLIGAVGRAVIRQDDLQRLIGLGKCPLDRLADEPFLIVGDDREGHQGALCRLGHLTSLIGQPSHS